MRKLRKVRKSHTGVVSALLLACMLLVPVSAQLVRVYPRRTVFAGVGWFTSTQPPEDLPAYGDRCFFRINGVMIGERWKASGRWVDLDWHEGVLVAEFRPTGEVVVMHDPEPGHVKWVIFIGGETEVFIDGQHIGTDHFLLALADGRHVTGSPSQGPQQQADTIGITIGQPGSDPWYDAGCTPLEEMTGSINIRVTL